MVPITILASPPMEPMQSAIAAHYVATGREGLDVQYATIEWTQFASKEWLPQIPYAVRRRSVYLLHPMQWPDPNERYMQLVLAMDALTRASCSEVTVVAPFFPYMRQDRKVKARQPISGARMIRMLEAFPSYRGLITVDLHCGQGQGFGDLPVDNLYGSIILARHFRDMYQGDFSQVIVMSPDAGGVERAELFAGYLGKDVPVGMMLKRRGGPNQIKKIDFVGNRDEVEGRDAIFVDDMIDTAGSLAAGAEKLRTLGARKIFAAATHPVFSMSDGKSAEERLIASGVKTVVLDTIPRSDGAYLDHHCAGPAPWLTIMPVAPLLADAIYEASRVGGSMSSLFVKK